MRLQKFKYHNRQQNYERKLMSNRTIQIQMLSMSLSESVSVSLPYAIPSVSIFKQSRYSSGKTYSTQCKTPLSNQPWFWMLDSVKSKSKHVVHNSANNLHVLHEDVMSTYTVVRWRNQ